MSCHTVTEPTICHLSEVGRCEILSLKDFKLFPICRQAFTLFPIQLREKSSLRKSELDYLLLKSYRYVGTLCLRLFLKVSRAGSRSCGEAGSSHHGPFDHEALQRCGAAALDLAVTVTVTVAARGLGRGMPTGEQGAVPRAYAHMRRRDQRQ